MSSVGHVALLEGYNAPDIYKVEAAEPVPDPSGVGLFVDYTRNDTYTKS